MTGVDGEEEWNQTEKLPDDLIIADEFGMCDMYLAYKFFYCIRQGAALVMIGDQDQLGSVGPGNVFKEMIESGVIPVTVLDACFRQDEGSTIVENARRINRHPIRRMLPRSSRRSMKHTGGSMGNVPRISWCCPLFGKKQRRVQMP